MRRARLPETDLIAKQALQDLLLILDLGGTFVFAVSGAMVGGAAAAGHLRRAGPVLRRLERGGNRA